MRSRDRRVADWRGGVALTVSVFVWEPSCTLPRHGTAGAVAASPCAFYRPRVPQATPLCRLVEAHYGDVRDTWEDRSEGYYGFWRGVTDKAVVAYLDCGILDNGFARVRCGACRAEFLVAFSCKGRGLCPSCAAKRAAALAAFLREEVLADVGHAQWVFSIPKMLRPYFLYHRPLLGRLCQAAYQAAREMIAAASPAPDDIQPGMIAVVQTFGDDLGWHPHVHALVSRGGWDQAGVWTGVPFVSGEAAALVFRHRVFAFLQAEGLLSEERTRLLLSWRHTGFSVHTSVTVPPDDRDGLERLARYLLRPPVSLERLRVDEQASTLAYAGRRRLGDDPRLEAAERDPKDFLARILMHIPEPRRHMIRYYGAYSSVVRARRARQSAAAVGTAAALGLSQPVEADTTDPDRRALRRTWAQLIRRIYEVDPLVCPRCGGTMRIIAFITESRVVGQILKHLAAKGVDARSPPVASPLAAFRDTDAA
jgi:hypothetical protein